MLEDKVKLYESMYSQVKLQHKKTEVELLSKQSENDRIINELKTTKIHIALLEEQSSQRELYLKQQLELVQSKSLDSSLGEFVVNLHTTDVSCFNIGK